MLVFQFSKFGFLECHYQNERMFHILTWEQSSARHWFYQDFYSLSKWTPLLLFLKCGICALGFLLRGEVLDKAAVRSAMNWNLFLDGVAFEISSYPSALFPLLIVFVVFSNQGPWHFLQIHIPRPRPLNLPTRSYNVTVSSAVYCERISFVPLALKFDEAGCISSSLLFGWASDLFFLHHAWWCTKISMPTRLWWTDWARVKSRNMSSNIDHFVASEQLFCFGHLFKSFSSPFLTEIVTRAVPVQVHEFFIST